MRYDMSEIPKEFNPPITNAAYLLRRRLLQAIMRNIHELSGSMMDFGCGSKPYKSLFKVSEYVGVDYQGQGHSHENEIIDVFYDGHHLPFGDNRFDSIFSSEVFEHVFNLEEMVKELHRVLKPDGKMLVTCPFAICEHEAPNDFARYSSYGLKDLLERNGFEVLIFEKSGSAVETICQLYVSYFYAHVVRKLLGKIPVVRSLARVVIVPVLNAISVLLHALLPAGNDLYMNNIVVVRKK